MFLYILIVVAQLTGRGSRYVNALCTNDFEEGISSLKGWERSGDAFNNQPTYGDNPSIRKPGIHASHQGRYWIGTYEDRPKPDSRPGKVQSDFPTGKLTSPAFRITGTDINFLIGGGCDQSKVRAELLINGSVVEYDTGKCSETMRRVHWSVGRYRGQTAKIRLVDNSSQGWGHLNFDDLKGDMKCEDTASGSPITASTGSKITETIRSESPKMMEESNPTPMSPTGSPTTASAGSTTPSGKTSGNPKMMEGSNPTSMSPTGSPTQPSAGSTTPSGKTSGNPKILEGSKPTSMSPTGSPTQPSAGSTTIVGKTSRSPTLMEGSSRIPMSSSTGSPTKSSAGNNAGTNKTSSDFSPSKRMTTTQMNIKIKSLENLLYQGTPTKQIKQNDTNHPDYDCQVKFTKVGCFADKQSPPRPLKDLLFTEKDQSDLLNRKHDMKRKVCRCAEEAKRREFTVFGLQFYDECWSGKDAEKTYDVHKTSTNCFNSEFKPCQESDIECVGGPDANYVYRISNNNRVMDSVSLNKSTHNNYKLMDSLTTPSKKPKLHDSRLLNESSNKPFKDFKNLACKEFLIVLLLPTRWRDDLKNPNTLYYKKARENIEIQILNLYGEDEDFRGITFEKFGRTENRSISKMYAVLKFDNTDQYLTKLIDYFGARNVMAAGCYTPPRCPAFCSSKCFPSCQPSCCIATYQPQPSVDYTSNPTYQQAYQTQPIITYNTQPAVMGPLIYQTINPPLGNPEPQATPQNLITSLGPSCPDGCQFVCTTLCPQNCCKSVIQKSKKSHIKKAF